MSFSFQGRFDHTSTSIVDGFNLNHHTTQTTLNENPGPYPILVNLGPNNIIGQTNDHQTTKKIMYQIRLEKLQNLATFLQEDNQLNITKLTKKLYQSLITHD